MVKDVLKKLIFREKATSETYIQYLRKKGMKIGEDCTIYSPRNTVIDEQYPWLISIGNHVRITEGVILLTHDYSWSVLKRINVEKQSGAILGAAGKVEIGDNVFIGMNTIVLRGVHIGNNVVIGAGSVVARDCESGWVYAGNPAKKILKIEEYYMKRLEKQLDEAKILATSYYERFEKIPPKEIFHEFFMLFENKIPDNIVFKEKMKLGGNFEESCSYIKSQKTKFSNYDEFLKFCLEDGEK